VRRISLSFGWKLAGMIALAAGVLVLSLCLSDRRQSEPRPGPVAKVPPENFRVPTEPDKPEIEVTADHRLARIQHKDARGLSPLETVHTEQGVITIKRTFDLAGKLLKEEASLDGKSVAVPKL
jgi:hypothetical protein